MSSLYLGDAYSRPTLAALWGYKDWHAIGRGVTPAKQKHIILFVTKVKQEAQVQYEDHFDGDTLFMEGERTAVAANTRLQDAESAGDAITLFYRERHHSDFTFYGQIYLQRTEQSERGTPIFVFLTKRSHAISQSSMSVEKQVYDDDEFEPNVEGKRRQRWHISYERSAKNREEAIRHHGTRCAACSFSFNDFYGADFARDYVQIHHLRSVTEGERSVDPKADLAALCANCHMMAHRQRGKITSIEELRKLISKSAKQRSS